MNQALGFRAALPDPGLLGLYDYWRSLRERLGRLPRRSEIDPLDLPTDVLSGMMVLEREAAGRFRCRLAGTRMREAYGFEAAGLYLDDVMPPEAAAVRMRIYERVLGDRCAAFIRIRVAIPGREFVASDRLYVPALDAVRRTCRRCCSGPSAI
ncbi:MAG: PAS domain-containing protein [Thalassobaculaceae bacterium]|nr:PAS domain-containing protein [Thalassobaculaceae bacterium]